ncbi:hypothetical protein HQ576_19860, partial [bacterium]|nr:hypothetical protein [bacterium]
LAAEKLRALMQQATRRPALFYHDDPARSKRFSQAWERWRKALGLDK